MMSAFGAQWCVQPFLEYNNYDLNVERSHLENIHIESSVWCTALSSSQFNKFNVRTKGSHLADENRVSSAVEKQWRVRCTPDFDHTCGYPGEGHGSKDSESKNQLNQSNQMILFSPP